VSFYVCANSGENRSINATVRVRTDGQTDRRTEANRFYNLSHAICYSYGAGNEFLSV